MAGQGGEGYSFVCQALCLGRLQVASLQYSPQRSSGLSQMGETVISISGTVRPSPALFRLWNVS
jgi:hypothetical protein